MKFLLFVATALLAATSVRSNTINTICQLVVFGDSLSDTGNANTYSSGNVTRCRYTATNGSALNYQGSYTNGPAWPIVFAESTQAVLRNYAYGGATSSSSRFPNPPAVPDFMEQIAMSTGLTIGMNDVAVVWIGANDVTTSVANDAMLVANSTALGEMFTASIAKVKEGVATLATRGYKNIAVLTLLPSYWSPWGLVLTSVGVDLKALTVAYDTALMYELSLLAPTLGNGVNMVSVNMTEVFEPIHQATMGNPAASYNLGPCMLYDPPSVTNICENPNTPVNITYCNASSSTMWFDSQHPTKQIHAMMATGLQAKLEAAFPPLTTCGDPVSMNMAFDPPARGSVSNVTLNIIVPTYQGFKFGNELQFTLPSDFILDRCGNGNEPCESSSYVIGGNVVYDHTMQHQGSVVSLMFAANTTVVGNVVITIDNVLLPNHCEAATYTAASLWCAPDAWRVRRCNTISSYSVTVAAAPAGTCSSCTACKGTNYGHRDCYQSGVRVVMPQVVGDCPATSFTNI